MRICFRSTTTSSPERNKENRNWGMARALAAIVLFLLMGTVSGRTVSAEDFWEPLPTQEEQTETETEPESEADTQSILPDLDKLPSELTGTIRETGEEMISEAVDEVKEEVQAKAKEVKHNILVRLWEHIKKMFQDFFASIFS